MEIKTKINNVLTSRNIKFVIAGILLALAIILIGNLAADKISPEPQQKPAQLTTSAAYEDRD